MKHQLSILPQLYSHSNLSKPLKYIKNQLTTSLSKIICLNLIIFMMIFIFTKSENNTNIIQEAQVTQQETIQLSEENIWLNAYNNMSTEEKMQGIVYDE